MINLFNSNQVVHILFTSQMAQTNPVEWDMFPPGPFILIYCGSKKAAQLVFSISLGQQRKGEFRK